MSRLRASSGRSVDNHFRTRQREFTRLITSLKAQHENMIEPKPSWPAFRDRELQAKRASDGKRLSYIGTDLAKIRSK